MKFYGWKKASPKGMLEKTNTAGYLGFVSLFNHLGKQIGELYSN